jgi:16S rRNA processing protein RimM
MAKEADRVLLGHIGAAHGIRGEVVVVTYTAEPEAIAGYGPLEDEAGSAKFALTVVRTSGKGLICRVAGISDRNAAEALRGTGLYLPRSRLPPPQAEEFYLADLIGLVAVDSEGRTIGSVVAVQNFGAGDLVEIRLAGTRRSEFLPFTKVCVPLVDLDGGRIVVAPPDGWLDADASD